jgi:hypothetical protein
MANSLCSQGFVRIALGENRQAQRCFQESLEIIQDQQAVDLILENLIGLAKLLSEDGKKRQALELVSCVLDHTGIALQARNRAEQLVSELEPFVPLHTLEMTREQGRGNDIRHYVRLYGTNQLAS